MGTRTRLTMIEKLDAQFPGLADEVRKRFAEGVPAHKIAEQILEKYQVAISASTVSSFRCRRWVPEQKRLQEKRLDALVARELAREQELTAEMVRPLPDPGK